MKILWYVNIVMPKAAELFGLQNTNAGGWLIEQSIRLSELEEVDLIISNVAESIDSKDEKEWDGIKYILFSKKKYKDEFKKVLESEKPDVVHIFGTEYDYNTYLISLCEKMNIKFIVSIQGLMSEYSKHYSDGLPEKFNKVNPILRLMKKIYPVDSIALNKNDFYLNGIKETIALKKCKNIIGRTDWDKYNTTKLNEEIQYFKVNECLRREFYTNEEWVYGNCLKHSIFISQANYPIKGFHQFLKILPNLIQRYPDLKVYVGGSKWYSLNNDFLDMIVDYFFEYQKYIKTQIKKNKLENHIIFTGSLNAEQMKERYLKCNLFLSPSTIENSSNSIGEAMILGVPIVSSDVGGTSSVLTKDKDGLMYDFYDEQSMLDNICKVLDNEDFARVLGKNAKEHAQQTHNIKENTKTLMQTYYMV